MFVTENVDKRRPVFKQDFAAEAFLRELQDLKVKMECKLVAFVLMLDHFHLVINPRDGNIREWTGALKSLTAKNLVKICPKDWFEKVDGEHQVWQQSFKALPLWSDWMIWQKINYIHSNPLKAGLVKTTSDYRWSSFHSFYGEQSDLLLRVDQDWWWPDDVQKLARAMYEWEKEAEAKWLDEKAREKEREERGQSRPS